MVQKSQFISDMAIYHLYVWSTRFVGRDLSASPQCHIKVLVVTHLIYFIKTIFDIARSHFDNVPTNVELYCKCTECVIQCKL